MTSVPLNPLVVNGAKNRLNIVIGGHFRLKIFRKLGYKTVPVVYVNIPNVEREKELNLRLNKKHRRLGLGCTQAI